MGSPDAPYHHRYDPAWEEFIKRSFRREQKGNDWVVVGECPSCTHEIARELPIGKPPVWGTFRTTVSGPLGPASGSNSISVSLECECPNDHKGRPTGTSGCGAYFGVTI